MKTLSTNRSRFVHKDDKNEEDIGTRELGELVFENTITNYDRFETPQLEPFIICNSDTNSRFLRERIHYNLYTVQYKKSITLQVARDQGDGHISLEYAGNRREKFAINKKKNSYKNRKRPKRFAGSIRGSKADWYAITLLGTEKDTILIFETEKLQAFVHEEMDKAVSKARNLARREWPRTRKESIETGMPHLKEEIDKEKNRVCLLVDEDSLRQKAHLIIENQNSRTFLQQLSLEFETQNKGDAMKSIESKTREFVSWLKEPNIINLLESGVLTKILYDMMPERFKDVGITRGAAQSIMSRLVKLGVFRREREGSHEYRIYLAFENFSTHSVDHIINSIRKIEKLRSNKSNNKSNSHNSDKSASQSETKIIEPSDMVVACLKMRNGTSYNVYSVDAAVRIAMLAIR